MRIFHRLGLATALGAVTVAGGLLAAAPNANAQGAPPGFFQVPGTSTALLITGQVGTRAIYDANGIQDSPAVVGVEADVLIPLFIPIKGTCPAVGTCNGINAAGSNSSQFHFSSQDYSLGFITSTPTAWGELGTVLILGAGNDVFSDFGPVGTAFHSTGLVVGFGTLGPFMAGMNSSLFGDTDAAPDTFGEPLALAGQVGGLQPSFRYTWKGPNGISIAGSIEAPFTTDGATGSLVGNFENSLLGSSYPAGAGFGPDNVFSSGTLNGGTHIPDFVLRARWDQPWGHISIAGLLHDNSTNCTLNCNPLSNFESVGGGIDGVTAPTGSQASTAALLYGVSPNENIPDLSRMGWGVNVTGHFNTWGKDTLKWGIFGGQGLGAYMGDYGDTGIYAQVCTHGSFTIPTPCTSGATSTGAAFTGAAYIPYEMGGYISYQHFWTDALRSTVGFGLSHVFINDAMVNNYFIENEQMDTGHWSTVANLVWSPVPKVDLGIEYIYYHRKTASAFFAGSDTAIDNRIEGGAVFHF